MTKHFPINFSPFATNVLDVIGRDDLTTPDGVPARIVHEGSHFLVTIGDKQYRTDDNVHASFIFNQHQVGTYGKAYSRGEKEG